MIGFKLSPTLSVGFLSSQDFSYQACHLVQARPMACGTRGVCAATEAGDAVLRGNVSVNQVLLHNNMVHIIRAFHPLPSHRNLDCPTYLAHCCHHLTTNFRATLHQHRYSEIRPRETKAPSPTPRCIPDILASQQPGRSSTPN